MLGHARSERRWQEEDLDEYEEEEDEEEEEERYAEEGEEEEEEAEEEQKPTAEELEYLSIREKMKAKLRLKLQKENAALLGRSGASGDHRRALPNAEFGCFFGPSKPAIARRVIEERHSLQETQHMRAKDPISSNIVKRGHVAPNGEKREPISSNGQAKSNARADHLKAVKEIRSKAQALKDMRDYSFLLSDDADIPAPAREPPPRKPSIPLTDARPAQAPQRTKAEVNKHSAVAVLESRGLKKPVPASQKIPPPKVIPQKPPPISRPNPPSSVPKSISNGTVGNGPSRFPNEKAGPASSHQNMTVKKLSATSMNKSAIMDGKPIVKPGSSSQTKNVERRKEVHVLPREKLVAKQPMPSSRPQQQITSNKPKPQLHPQPNSHPQSQRQPQPQPQRQPQQSMPSSKIKVPGPQVKSQLPISKTKPSKPITQHQPPQKTLKRKPISRYSDDIGEDEEAINMIRQMFRYNPNKYAGADDDVSDMEANFDDIQKEERRSAKIARREDEEELRLIEEEERRERMRKMAKKRKLG